MIDGEELDVMDGSDDGRSDRTVVRGLRSTVGRESTTFGFSILATANFGVLQVMHGTPDIARVFLFSAGAVLSFTLLEAVLSRGFRKPMPQHDTRVQAAGTSLNLISVLGGLAVTWLTATVVPHAAAWALAPFLGTLVYLLFESIETALSERLLARTGVPDADEVTP